MHQVVISFPPRPHPTEKRSEKNSKRSLSSTPHPRPRDKSTNKNNSGNSHTRRSKGAFRGPAAASSWFDRSIAWLTPPQQASPTQMLLVMGLLKECSRRYIQQIDALTGPLHAPNQRTRIAELLRFADSSVDALLPERDDGGWPDRRSNGREDASSP